MRRITPVLLTTAVLITAAPSLADYAVGVAAFKAKNYAEAIKEFQNSIEELKLAQAEDDPQYAPYYMMLGRAYFSAGQLDKAIDPFRTALKLNPKDVGAQLLLGQTYYKQQNYKAAAATLGSLNLEALPASTRGQVSNMLAASYERSGQGDLALANLEKAAKLNPNDATAQFNYGVKALAANYTTESVAALAKAVQIEGSSATYRKAYGNALIRQGRETRDATAKKAVYAKAAANGEQLVRAANTFDNLLHLAEAQLGAQQYAQASGSLDQAIAKSSSNWLPYYYKGQALTALQKFTEALAPLKIAQSKSPSVAEQKTIWGQIGFVHEKLRNYAESKDAYTKAGDQRGLARVAENEAIASENKQTDAHNAEIQRLEAERKALEEQMKALPGGGAPPR